MMAQIKAWDWLSDLQEEHGCPIALAGDTLHHWKASPSLLVQLLRHFPRSVYATIGQHDIRQHNLETLDQSGMMVLSEADRVTLLEEGVVESFEDFDLHSFPYGTTPRKISRPSSKPRVALCHLMTWHKETPFPGCTSDNATALLERLQGFQLVVTGDNHIPFVVEDEGRFLVNPGSLLRFTAAQRQHRPRVYLWYADQQKVKTVYAPIDKTVVSRAHIETKEEVDKRIESFVKHLNTDWEVGLSFTRNMKSFLSTNKGTNKRVQKRIWTMCEE